MSKASFFLGCIFCTSRSTLLPLPAYRFILPICLYRSVGPSNRPCIPPSILPSDASVHNPTLCLTPGIGSIEHPYPCSLLRAGLVFQLGSILRHNNPPPPHLFSSSISLTQQQHLLHTSPSSGRLLHFAPRSSSSGASERASLV